MPLIRCTQSACLRQLPQLPTTAAFRSTSPSSASSHVWIPDELLSASYTRFASACSPPLSHLCKRRNATTLLPATETPTRSRSASSRYPNHCLAALSPAQNRSTCCITNSCRPRLQQLPRHTSASGRHYVTIRRIPTTPGTFNGTFLPTKNERSRPRPDKEPATALNANQELIIQTLLRAAHPSPSDQPNAPSDARQALDAVISANPDSNPREYIPPITKHLIGPAIRDQVGFYRQSRAADIWLTTLRNSSPTVDPQAVDAALSMVAARCRLRDLPIFFSAQTSEDICLSLLRYWPPRTQTRLSDAMDFDFLIKRLPRLQGVFERAPSIDAYKHVRSTPFPQPSEAHVQPSETYGQPSEAYGHLQPFIDLLAVLCKQRKPAGRFFEDILEYLWLNNPPSDLIFFCETLQRFGIVLPNGLRRRWIMAHVADQPNLAYRLFRLRVPSNGSRILAPADLPGFIEALVASPQINPLNIHGLLLREKVVCERVTPRARKRQLVETTLDVADAFARCGRLPTFRARQANVMRLHEFYNSLGAPPSERLADAIVLVSLLLPPLEGRTPTLTEREDAQKAIEAVSGQVPAQEVHLATMAPSIAKIHIRRHLEDKYGPGWAALLNIDSSQAEPQPETAV